MQEALTGLGIAFLLMLTGLVRYIGPAAKAALVSYTESKHQKAIDNAAETLAVAAAKGGATPLDKSMETQVATLRRRLPDAMDALAPSDATLRDILQKAASRAVAR